MQDGFLHGESSAGVWGQGLDNLSLHSQQLKTRPGIPRLRLRSLSVTIGA
jgi:hypothetical protein